MMAEEEVLLCKLVICTKENYENARELFLISPSVNFQNSRSH